MSDGWDSATLKKLKALTGKGLSTAEIGKRLGRSKNAVVGKLNRLGWNLKANVATDKKSTAKAKASATKKTPAKAAGAKVVAKPKKVVVVKKATKVKDVKPATKVAKVKPVSAKSVKKPVAKAKVVKPAKTAAKAAPKAKVAKPVPAAKAKRPTERVNKNLAMRQRVIQHALEMANLKPNQCRWPIGDPDSDDFHFCGAPVFVGKPYCYEHCRQAYQFTPPRKK